MRTPAQLKLTNVGVRRVTALSVSLYLTFHSNRLEQNLVSNASIWRQGCGGGGLCCVISLFGNNINKDEKQPKSYVVARIYSATGASLIHSLTHSLTH